MPLFKTEYEIGDVIYNLEIVDHQVQIVEHEIEMMKVMFILNKAFTSYIDTDGKEIRKGFMFRTREEAEARLKKTQRNTQIKDEGYKVEIVCPKCGGSQMWSRFVWARGEMRHTCSNSECEHTWYTPDPDKE